MLPLFGYEATVETAPWRLLILGAVGLICLATVVGGVVLAGWLIARSARDRHGRNGKPGRQGPP